MKFEDKNIEYWWNNTSYEVRKRVSNKVHKIAISLHSLSVRNIELLYKLAGSPIYYKTKPNTYEKLESIRWNNGIICPFCNSSLYSARMDGIQYRCKNNICKRDFSVISKTIFENTKLPLDTWIEILKWLTMYNNPLNSHRLSKQFNITQKTAWHIIQKIKLLQA